ncbi:hypothetical protein GYM62_13610 [Algoriphagus sp. NBT04N3]|jgi:hypothetical protein|uniref:hypothetical protein n=1 Tax=Algoriphagus sp. NBT04N3 TaxID=2705473 RepID=UPI001C633023|nr:hypothetical protein [Algoriphagus sp. NBT04N3]QYH39769.1 hypothetical protein GYM62_13610 [Algoriphagus sp. NBT04N3]
MAKKVFVILLVLLFLGASAYYVFVNLGGKNPIEITWEQKTPPPLSGIYFVGIPQDEKLAEAFKEMEGQKNLRPGSSLHTIYEVEPAGKLDTMKVFIGLNQSLTGEKYETRIFTESSYLLATIRGNKWVMPGPETVKEELKTYADSANLTLTGIYIDQIISESEVRVIAPVKE